MRYRAGLLFVSALVVGCGGLTREVVYRPVAPVAPDAQARVGREVDSSWHLDLDGAELQVLDVTLSSKLVWVFGPLIALPVSFLEEEVPTGGPLRIRIRAMVEPGARLAFDTREFALRLEDGRTLSPKTAEMRRFGSTESEEVEAVALPGEGTWLLSLLYDVPLADLPPFDLRVGALSIDGRHIEVPPIPFAEGKTYSGS